MGYNCSYNIKNCKKSVAIGFSPTCMAIDSLQLAQGSIFENSLAFL